MAPIAGFALTVSVFRKVLLRNGLMSVALGVAYMTGTS